MDAKKRMAIALSQFLVTVEHTDGTYSVNGQLPWSERPMVESARAALFDAVQEDPTLLEGTSLAVRPYYEDAGSAVVLAGPCDQCEDLAGPGVLTMAEPLDGEPFRHRYPCLLPVTGDQAFCSCGLIPADDCSGDCGVLDD